MSIEPPEVTVTPSPRVACDGGEGALGHPRVWMQIDESLGWVECRYCDRRFVLEGHAVEEPGSNVSVGRAVGDRTDGDGLDQPDPPRAPDEG